MKENATILCPAYRCKPGSKLLGVRQNDGRITILPQSLPIDSDFLEKAEQHHIAPERRFRFTNKCIEGGCKQWDGLNCTVAEKVMQCLEAVPQNLKIPFCPIRKSCRWHIQKGGDACKICTLIPTEFIEEEINQYWDNR